VSIVEHVAEGVERGDHGGPGKVTSTSKALRDREQTEYGGNGS
jgi:hypothetical protein